MKSCVDASTTCGFFIKQKNRFCRLQVATGKRYCGQHEGVVVDDTSVGGSGVQGDNNGTALKRLPCPNQCGHSTCSLPKMKRHLKVCNMRPEVREKKEMLDAVFYQKDINCKSLDEEKEEEMGDGKMNNTVEYKHKDAAKLITTMNKRERKKLLARVIKVLLAVIDSDVAGAREEEEEVVVQVEDHIVKPLLNMESRHGEKHHVQHVALCGHLDALGLLASACSCEGGLQGKEDKQGEVQKKKKKNGGEVDDYCYVELGAGKAELLYWVRMSNCLRQGYELEGLKTGFGSLGEKQMEKKLPNGDGPLYVAIDMENRKCKFDRLFKGSRLVRKCINIKDLNLAKAPFLHTTVPQNASSAKVVAFSKHLCGNGTDVALRCLARLHHEGEKEPAVMGRQGKRLEGLVIGTCCHCKCEWETYCARNFMRENGVDSLVFHVMTLMTAWAVCGFERTKRTLETAQSLATVMESLLENNGDDKDDEDAAQASLLKFLRYELTVEQRVELGYTCKRLFDEGRVRFLRKELGEEFQVQKVVYCSRKASPENMLLIASRR
eukprot:Nk52_evm2s307 gene=Nk52_evmTU2s307